VYTHKISLTCKDEIFENFSKVAILQIPSLISIVFFQIKVILYLTVIINKRHTGGSINLIDNWRFHLGDVADAWSKTYQDTGWDIVTIPHDWSVKQPFSMEYSSGTGYVAGGIGWYRCSFYLDEKYRGK
jgi:hypothetical protein